MKKTSSTKKKPITVPIAHTTFKDAVSGDATNANGTTTPDVVTVDRKTLLEGIIPDANWAGRPELTALVYAADELEALSVAEENGFDTTDMLFRLQSRLRAIAAILGGLDCDKAAKDGAA